MDEKLVSQPRNRRRAIWMAAFLVLLVSALSVPGGLGAESRQLDGAASVPDLRAFALLINMGGLVFDLEGYGGGIGFKAGRDDTYLRLLFDLQVHSVNRSFLVALGATYEHHFGAITAPVSPYWGITGSLGLTTQKDVDALDSGTWMSVTSAPLGAAGVVGVEIFVTEHVTLFVEYALMVELAVIHTAQSATGTVTRQTYTEFSIDAGLGNRSKIGMAIYLPTPLPPPQRRPRSACSY